MRPELATSSHVVAFGLDTALTRQGPVAPMGGPGTLAVVVAEGRVRGNVRKVVFWAIGSAISWWSSAAGAFRIGGGRVALPTHGVLGHARLTKPERGVDSASPGSS